MKSFLLVSGVCLAVLRGSAASGQTTVGSLDNHGQVMTKVVLTMNDPRAYGRPGVDVVFLIEDRNGDRISVRTNAAGVASAWLEPGDYRLVTPEPFDWQGNEYTWDKMVSVRAGMRTIQLNQENARSVNPSVLAQGGQKTREPVATPQSASNAAAARLVESAEPSVPEARSRVASDKVMSDEARPRATAGSNHQMREGFWFNIGTGYGAISCKECYASYGGYSGGLSMGGTISPRFLLGVGTTGWYKSENGATVVAGTVDARIRFYPSATGGFFLTGGLGLGTISADLADYGSASEAGAGAVLGLGWDLRVGEGISITPFWNGFGVATAHADASVGQIGLGITVH